MATKTNILMLLAAMATGCSADDVTEQAAESEQDEPTQQTSSALALAGSVGITNVVASGAGCPLGSFYVARATDGLSATISFRAFKIAVNPSIMQDLKTCSVGATLASSAGVSLAVTELSIDGASNLQRNVAAVYGVAYLIAGSPLGPRPMTQRFFGPRVAREHVTFPLSSTARIWTPCGENRQVQFDLTDAVTNPNRGVGSAEISAFTVRLVRKQC